ncbi:MAG: hypothetical protein HY812_10515 [Planctomycetes bacterium]|nr:hypothetical protein [Planctomycetota bacterium]
MTAKPRDLAPGAQKKLKGLLDRAEREHGKLRILKDAPALEQALFLILREGNDFRKAAKALKILEREYVEWNELRVATPKEIVAVLKDCGLASLDDKISRILALLARLFYDFHKKDLEFVAIFEGPQRERIMKALDPLGDHIRYVLLQLFEDRSMEPNGLVVSMDVMNKVHRLGLARKTASPNVAKKILEKLVDKADYCRFHYFIHRV